MKIWVVDAFTSTPFCGNPAGVVLVTEFPSQELCHHIVTEFGLPEIGFLKKLDKNHYHIRWFSPKVEVPLCGHGTLAAAHVLFQEDLIQGKKITFESLSGPLQVFHKDQKIILNFPLIRGEKTTLKVQNLKDLLGIKSLTQAYSTGNFVIAELSDETELRSLHLDPEQVRQIEYPSFVITAKAASPYDFVSRVYSPRKGINEDAVTGSAHCLLVDYWREKLGKSHFLAYQASARGGELDLTIEDDRVLIQGQAVTILVGDLKNENYKEE